MVIEDLVAIAQIFLQKRIVDHKTNQKLNPYHFQGSLHSS